jgi:hypothetical protein
MDPVVKAGPITCPDEMSQRHRVHCWAAGTILSRVSTPTLSPCPCLYDVALVKSMLLHEDPSMHYCGQPHIELRDVARCLRLQGRLLAWGSLLLWACLLAWGGLLLRGRLLTWSCPLFRGRLVAWVGLLFRGRRAWMARHYRQIRRPCRKGATI